MKKCYIILLVLLYTALFAQNVERLPGSPYPASTVPDTLTTVYSSALSESELLTIATLQGLLAKTKPRIYQLYNSGANKWASDLKNRHGIILDREIERNFAALIDKFKDEIEGYVLCTPGNSSVNVAISLCGITHSVAIAADKVTMFSNLGIPQTADVRDKNEEWFFTNYDSLINKNILIYQKEDKYGFLSDYATFGNMISFFEPLSGATSRKIFQSMNPQSPLLGWGDSEFDLVNRSSAYSILVHPADWAKNISTLTNFNVELKQKQHIQTAKVEPDVHTVCFLFSDGDNVQWFLNEFATNSRWYGSTKRGKVDLGWTLPPAMAEMAPTALKWIYDDAASTATGRDYFVTGPSGLGYVYADQYKDLDGYASLTNDFMEKGDFKIVNLIGNSDDDRYLEPFLEQQNVEAILFYFFSNYSGGAGKVKWVKNKPVIHGRYNYWDGFETTASLADKINRASRDIYSSQGYSLIPVHNWSRSVNNVLSCVSLLDSDVRVVAPDEFVALIKQNLKPMSVVESFKPTNNEIEQKYLVPEYPGTGQDAVSRWADGNDKVIYKFAKEDLLALSDGQDDLRLRFVVSNEFLISVAPDIDSEPTLVHRWSDNDTHVHDNSNRARQVIDLKPYFDMGWQDVYVIFEDGIKSDGWGANITYGQIFKSDLTTAVDEKQSTLTPADFELAQNYPNPFNPETSISYSLQQPGDISLKIYNTLGRQIFTLVDSYQTAGTHNVLWNGFDDSGHKASSGIYFYQLASTDKKLTRKMMLVQ
jgi:hypothetical protein